MNKKRKAIIRERDRLAREREEVALAENWERISTSTGGFSRSPIKAQPRKHLAEMVESRFPGRYVPTKVESKPDGSWEPKEPPKYTGEMLAREQRAILETEALKARVAPLGNKMGAQYMNDSDLADFKAGKLRRRG